MGIEEGRVNSKQLRSKRKRERTGRVAGFLQFVKERK